MQSQQYAFADVAAPVTAPEFLQQPARAVRDEEVCCCSAVCGGVADRVHAASFLLMQVYRMCLYAVVLDANDPMRSQQFFYKYFTERARRMAQSKAAKKQTGLSYACPHLSILLLCPRSCRFLSEFSPVTHFMRRSLHETQQG